ncbi:MAG: bifunctional 5,10-methylene-tetrahydrofolate dehydrogenase/5,10-methylene-tetrahydrofolate cyclohydrolase, partial [Lachnospiraceae bacterium]|nr:bifunctional 5,10-methylene-tetrahydrofolate dehydrogenase/5,10-methylene-tetrahydrofolate cyclohydrolase [Lachnospiraceae bacterium]
MITLKGVEVSAKIKLQVQEILEKMNGYVPTAAIVRVGERPDDLSYEKGVIKKLASFGMEAKTFAFPEDISEEEFLQEFKKINADESIDGIL